MPRILETLRQQQHSDMNKMQDNWVTRNISAPRLLLDLPISSPLAWIAEATESWKKREKNEKMLKTWCSTNPVEARKSLSL